MMIKVCGVTTREDAEAAAAAGATAIGFNFYPKSPRRLTPERAAEIGRGLVALKVGVFVNEPPEKVEETARIAGLDVAQLHGEEPASAYPKALRVWKAVRVGPGFELAQWEEDPAEALLLDGPAELLYGGAGVAFDWRRAAGGRRRIVLAGGLDAGNVAQAIQQARPWGVDACSRIEIAPGKKDHEKMRQFIQAARAAFSC
jgi:phosphoribosylanthranilate isomerase